ncbi:hypothetical protein MRB53_014179 [Persea americana]|uniref:Uncharacterized protein n=1 Tax=Persea americana TaxID=3435 RepID=A0ACC2KA31_PERAE|nr:hypothetical protein MRB53_014179 [Persea americana]
MNESVLHIYYCRVITFSEILSQCPDRSSTKWYNDCMIRYSIINFLGSSRTPTWDYLSNPLNATNPVQFEKILGNLMNNLSTRAAFEPRTGMFATGEANLSSPSTFFYWASTIEVPAPSPAPTVAGSPWSTNETTTGRDHNSSRIVVILIPAIVIAIILLVIVSLLRIMKKNTNLRKKKTSTSAMDQLDGSEVLLQIDFEMIRVATNDFSDENKLGEGNGKKIDIWYDQWLQRAQIAPLFPNYSFPYDDRLSKLAFDGIWQVPPSLPADIANFLSRNLSQYIPSTPSSLWSALASGGTSLARPICAAIFFAVTYAIWLQRNDAVFNGAVPPSARAKSLIEDCILFSIVNLPGSKAYPLLTIIRHLLGVIIPL